MSIDVIKDLEMSTSGSSDSENEPPSPEYPGDNGDTPCTSGTHHRKQLFCSSAKRQHSGTDQDNHPQLLTILEEVKKTNICLSQFSSRLDAVENRIISIERQHIVSASSGTDSSMEKGKNKVPARVRVSIYTAIITCSCV